MIHQRRPPHIGYLKRRIPKWEKNNNTVLFYVTSTLLMFLLITSPFVYFANENFKFFQSLAVDSSPSLLSHLEREQLLFNLTYILISSFITINHWWFVNKYIRNFRGQVQAFDRHLKHLIRGEWFTPPLRVREKDDFKNLAEQYGYFYKSLQAMTKSEIQILEKMKIDPSQRENFTLWKMLLQQKKSRLGYEEIINENTNASNSSVHWNRSG